MRRSRVGGGGILNSADLLHRTSEEELYRQAMGRIREIAAMGTGCRGDQERLRALRPTS